MRITIREEKLLDLLERSVPVVREYAGDTLLRTGCQLAWVSELAGENVGVLRAYRIKAKLEDEDNG